MNVMNVNVIVDKCENEGENEGENEEGEGDTSIPFHSDAIDINLEKISFK